MKKQRHCFSATRIQIDSQRTALASSLLPGRSMKEAPPAYEHGQDILSAMLEEARAAESKRDFISKCSIGLKEGREAHVRLKVMEVCRIGPTAEASALREEAHELISIVGAIIRNTRRNAGLESATFLMGGVKGDRRSLSSSWTFGTERGFVLCPLVPPSPVGWCSLFPRRALCGWLGRSVGTRGARAAGSDDVKVVTVKAWRGVTRQA